MTVEGQECPWAERTVLLALHALEPAEEARVARHVRACAACRTTTREAEETFAAVGETAAAPPPPGLRDRVLAATRESPRRAPRWEPRRWVTVAAAAALLAGIVGGGIVVGGLDRQRDAATVHAATPDQLLDAIATSPHAVLVDRDLRPVAAVALGDVPRLYDLGLPAAPAGRMWVLWGARGATATALGAVPAASRIDEALPVPVGRLGEYEAYELSEEVSTGALPDHPAAVVAAGPVLAARS